MLILKFLLIILEVIIDGVFVASKSFAVFNKKEYII